MTTSPSVYIGIDNGFTGAIAALIPGHPPFFEPVTYDDLGKDKFLNVDANLALIENVLSRAGCSKENVLVAVERCQANPKFGAPNNFTNGRNNEFWRVLLTGNGFPFVWANPKTWQKHVFSGMSGSDTGKMAELALRQLFPGVSLKGLTTPQREGITDAILIARWASQNFGWIPSGGSTVFSSARPISASP